MVFNFLFHGLTILASVIIIIRGIFQLFNLLRQTIMPYGVTMFADHDTEQVIWDIWYRLKEYGITTFMLDNKVRPHITMAIYDKIDTDQFLEEFMGFVKVSSPVPLILSSVGTFLKSTGTVIVEPALTPQLMSMYSDFHECFNAYTPALEPFSRPGKWMPHFTLSSHLDRDQVIRTIETALTVDFPEKSMIREIGFGEFNFEEKKKTYRVNWLYYFQL